MGCSAWDKAALKSTAAGWMRLAEQAEDGHSACGPATQSTQTAKEAHTITAAPQHHSTCCCLPLSPVSGSTL